MIINERTSVGLDVHTHSIVGAAVDTETGELFRQRLGPDAAGVVAWDNKHVAASTFSGHIKPCLQLRLLTTIVVGTFPAYRPRDTCILRGGLSPSDTRKRVISFSLEICTQLKGSFEGITRICKGIVLCHGLDCLYTRYPRVTRGLRFRRRLLTWQ